MQRTSTQYERDTARWYEFFLDVCKTLKKRGPFYHIAVHPSNEREFDELRERVREDEVWDFNHRGEPPRIIPVTQMSRDEYQPVDVRDLAPQKMAQVTKSATGLGRFSKLWTPGAGLKR